MSGCTVRLFAFQSSKERGNHVGGAMDIVCSRRKISVRKDRGASQIALDELTLGVENWVKSRLGQLGFLTYVDSFDSLFCL